MLCRSRPPRGKPPGLFGQSTRSSGSRARSWAKGGAKCHAEEFRAHQSSRHSRTLLRGPALAEIPYPTGPISDPDDPAVVHQFRQEAGHVVFQSKAGEKAREAVIAYAFGSADHYVSLVGTGDDRRPYIMRLSRYQSGADSGWVRTTGHSAGGLGGDVFSGKPLEPADGVYKCLYCHSTEPRAILQDSGMAATDRAIGCERCHGPGGNHQRAVDLAFADPAIVSPAAASGQARMGLCGQCHGHHQDIGAAARRSLLDSFPGDDADLEPVLSGKCRRDGLHELPQPASRFRTILEGSRPAVPGLPSSRGSSSDAIRCVREAIGRAGARVAPPTGGSNRRRSICPVSPASNCIGCHMPPHRSEPLHASFADHYIRVHPHSKPRPSEREGKPPVGSVQSHK